MTLFFIITFVILALLSWAWVAAIDQAKESYPDYKGEDLFEEFDETKKQEEK